MGKSEITITNKGGLNTSLVIIIFVLLILGGTGYYFMNKSKEKWVNLQAVEANNLKADIANKNNLIRVYQTSMSDLKASKDSIDKEIVKLSKKNKINTNKISALYYMVDSLSKVDTVRFQDTIFQKNVDIDTTLRYVDYSLRLQLKYPDTIVTTPSFINEKLVSFRDKKETIEKKKIWPLYYFQKKHTIIEVTIIDSNPFIKPGPNKFTHIIK